MDTPPSLLDFKLSQAALEVRYDNTYLIWDRAGLVWAKINSTWPDLKLTKSEPNITTFILGKQYELSIMIDKAHIVDVNPSSSLKDFMEKANDFINMVAKHLEISNFNRLGFRLIYIKTFPDKILAAQSLLSTKLLSVPEGRQFSIEGKVILPKYSLVWEGNSAAARVLLEVRDKKIDFDAHPGIEELKSVHLEKHELVYDVDYYTLGKVSMGQLNIKEWLSQIYHLVRRDSKYFLGGM